MRYLVLTAVSIVALAGVASASPPFDRPAYNQDHVSKFREHVNTVRMKKCLGRIAYRLSSPAVDNLDAAGRRHVRLVWKYRHWRAHAARSRCVPAWPWGALASCESGGRWAYNGSSGFDGGLQFLPSTWNMAKGYAGAGGYAYAWQAPPSVQVAVARAWLARTSWAQWPACARKLGLL